MYQSKVPPHPCRVSLNNSETVKPWHVAAFSNILLKTFLPNLLSLTCPSLHILGKIQVGIFLIPRFLVNPLENCHNSRTSDDIDMKPGPATKLYKRSKTMSKKLMMVSCQ